MTDENTQPEPNTEETQTEQEEVVAEGTSATLETPRVNYNEFRAPQDMTGDQKMNAIDTKRMLTRQRMETMKAMQDPNLDQASRTKFAEQLKGLDSELKRFEN